MNFIRSDKNSQQLSLKTFIPKHLIEYLCSDCKRFRIFDPASTLYCYLFQVMNACSCKTTLLYFNIQRQKLGLKKTSLNSSAYVKAKKRLCLTKLKEILTYTGNKIDESAKPWRFKDRDILLGDGTVLNLEDTEENKKVFPLTYRRGKQHGFPKLRLLALFSANSGAFIDGEIGAFCGKGQGETTLLRNMLGRVKKGSILVLDRFFTNYNMQYLIRSNGLDYVIRYRDKKAKKLLGKKSDIDVELKKLDKGTDSYFLEDAPKRMKVRIVRSTINRKGFRSSSLYIVTNLFKENGFSKKDIEQIYLSRWNVETDIRHLKTTLTASNLRSKSAEESKKKHGFIYSLII